MAGHPSGNPRSAGSAAEEQEAEARNRPLHLKPLGDGGVVALPNPLSGQTPMPFHPADPGSSPGPYQPAQHRGF